MIEQPARVEQFKQEIDAMQLRDPAVARERNLLRLGVILLIAGIVVSVWAVILDRGSAAGNNTQQLDAVVMGLLGVTLAIVGLGIYLRYSMGQFLRFWLARLSYEQQATADRLVGGNPPKP